MAEVTDTSLSNEILKPPMIRHAEIYENKPTVYIGPRKTDSSPQATFHYGDGKWLMLFKYKKDSKAASKAGKQKAKDVALDSKKKQEEVSTEKK